MAQDISNLAINASFQNLVQVSSSAEGNMLATATGTDFIVATASFALNSSNQESASYATSASVAEIATSLSPSATASYAVDAFSAKNAELADSAVSSSYALSASFSQNASTASIATVAISAISSTTAISSSYATTAGLADLATTASHALTAVSADSATTALTSSLLEGNATQVQSIDMEIGGIPAEQRMTWNDVDGTIDIGLKGGNVTLQVGQELVTRAVNKSGGDLLEADYSVVQILGAQGNRLSIDLALANGADAQSALGVVTETILNNQEGFITTNGLVRGIDTRGPGVEVWEDGDPLYLSAVVPGGLTNIKPSSPATLVQIGFVVNATVSGSIYVKIEVGTALTELNDVTIVSASNGEILLYNSVSELWENTPSSSLNVNTASLALNANSASNALRAVSSSIADDIKQGIDVSFNSGSFNDITATTLSVTNFNAVTSSVVITGDAFIQLNNDTPSQRYAGINVVDSGSANTTASFFFDGNTNDWNYEYNDGAVDYGVVMFGPEYTIKGSPIYNTANTLVKGDGGHHLLDSIITDDGTLVSVGGNLTANYITASNGFIGDLVGNASTATTASHALTAVSAGTAVSASHSEYASIAGIATLLSATATASYADLAGNARDAVSASFAQNSAVAVSASFSEDARTADSASVATFASTIAEILTQNITVNGATNGQVVTVAPSNSTSSIDLSQGNFFLCYLIGSADTHFTATNVQAGQNVNLKLLQTGGSGTVTFDTNKFKFADGTPFVGSAGASQTYDLVSAVSFDANSLVATGIQNIS